MTNLIKRRIIKSQRGAMDKVLVTFILLIIVMVAFVGLDSWVADHEDRLINKANSVIIDAQNG